MKIALLLASGASLAEAIKLQQQEKIKSDAEIDQEIEAEADLLDKNAITD